MKTLNEIFMEDFQNEFTSFQNIPTKNRSYNSKYSIVKEKVKSSIQCYNNSITSNFEKMQFSMIDPAFSDLEKIKTTKNIFKINKLCNTLSAIKKNSNIEVAKKYLIGFLEERGMSSLKQFITSLA